MANPTNKGLVLTFGLDDSSFANGVRGINQKLKQAQSEFKATSALVANLGDTVAGLGQKYRASQKVIEAQKEKVEALRKKYLDTKEAIENNAKATQKDKDNLLRSAQAYNTAVTNLAKYQDEMSKLQDEYYKTGGALGKLTEKINNGMKHIQNFGDKIKGVGDKVSELGSKMTTFGSVPIAGAMAAATKTAITFSDEMVKMGAVSNASKEDMEKLKNASLDASKSYGVSTSDYNDAATELLKSGYSVKESISIMNAGIKTSKATGEDLGTVLEKTSNTMKIYGYDAKDAAKVTDKLAYVANASKSSVQELGDGITKVGPVAHSLGMSLDTTSAALGVLQDRGFKVEEAATGLKSGLSNLINPSKANAEAFEKLGINVDEIKKKGLSLPKVLNDMATATKGMTKEQKEACISAAFGKESMAQWTALMEGDAQKALQDYTKGSQDATGSVDDLWKKMKDSPKQQIDELKGSFNAMAVNFGEKVIPVVVPALKTITEKINSLVDWFSKLSDGQQSSIVKWGLFAVAAGPVVIVVGKIVKAIGNLTRGFGSAFGAMGKLTRKTGEYISKTKDGENWTGKLGKKIKNVFTADSKAGIDSATAEIGELSNKAKDASDSVEGIQKSAAKADDSNKAFDNLEDELDDVKKKGKDAAAAVASIDDAVDSDGVSIDIDRNGGKKSNKGKDKDGKKTKNGNFNDLKGELDEVTRKGNTAAESVSNVYTAANNSKGTTKGGKGSKSGKGAGKSVSTVGRIGSVAGKIGRGALKVGEYAYFGDIIASAFGVESSVGSAISAIAEFAPTLATAATNPYVAVFAAAAGVVGGRFLYLWNTSEKFQTTVKGLPSTFRTSFSQGFDELQSGIDQFLGKEGMGRLVPGVQSVYNSLDIAKWVSEKYEQAELTTNTFTGRIEKMFSEMLFDVSMKVFGWALPWELRTKLLAEHANKTEQKSALGIIEEFSSKGHGEITNWIKKTSDAISGDETIAKSTETNARKATNKVADALDATGVSAGDLVNTLGGNGNQYKKKVSRYAHGTPKYGHPGGLAMVNDGNGPHYREAIITGDTVSIPKGRSVVGNLPAGSHVIPGRTTHELVQSGILRYKDGTDGGLFSKMWNGIKNIGKNVSGVIKNIVGDVMDWIDKPKELVDKVLDGVLGKFSDNPTNLTENISKYGVKNAKPSIVTIVQDLFTSMFSDGANGLDDAIAANGVYKYLVDMAMDIISKFGGQITSGYRPGSRNETGALDDHSQRLAIDIAGVGYGTFEKMKHYAVDKYKNKGLKYVIANNTWSRKSVGWAWTQYPYGAHADHMHLSGEKPSGKIFDAGSFKYAGRGVMPRSQISMLVKRALKANGLPTSGAWYNMVMDRVYQESGGNPRAINLWDSNAAAGHPSKGLVQMIDSTFNAYKFPGHNDIYNPYDNLLSAINYMKRNYGLQGMLNRVGIGYENGGLVTRHQLAQIGEGNKPEMVLPLTNKSRSVQLINKAKRLMGIEDEAATKVIDDKNSKLDRLCDGLDKVCQILTLILDKDTNIYLNDRELATRQAPIMRQTLNNMDVNYQRLRGGTI